MMKDEINIHVKINPSIYRSFCHFDTFRRQRRWSVPLLVSLLLSSLSLLLLFLRPEGAETIAAVFLGLSLSVPMIVFGLYFIQIQAQISSLGLKNVPEIYYLRLLPACLVVHNARQNDTEIRLPWKDLWGAFRTKNSIYLYVRPERAFILPDGQADVSPEELWTFLQTCLGKGKCRTVSGPAKH